MTEREEYAIYCVKHLRECLGTNVKSFALIGLLLKEAKGYFKDIPNTCYKNIYEFAKCELSLCRTTTKNYMAINTKFCDGNSVKDEYRKYNYSQLREMVKLSDEDLKSVNPSMTCKEIAKLCREIKKKSDEHEDELIAPFKEPENEYIILKNKEERLNYIKDYTKWELYKELEEFNLKFYRTKLSNGTYIIATESQQGKSPFGEDYYFSKVTPVTHWCLIDPNNENSRYDIMGYGGISAIEKYMSANKLKIKVKI